MEQSSAKEGCKESVKCIEILHLLLDNEASPTQEDYLRSHLDSCLPCLKNYKVETEIRNILRTKLEKREVPADLLNAIKSKISVSLAPEG
ncbi:zf-HC2 domain-containing protein [uncultured Imperialibacter sp.]|uniref:zf-HC2 domain-containing protein n=1 Tax=uncultured Imperialibacter sp. TaxID=1672639 RepID=UPI0030DDCC1D|tara:strand:- start:49542 stop:49811 length:270 start_codon:yes stop_codon:yes gene_type:complete